MPSLLPYRVKQLLEPLLACLILVPMEPASALFILPDKSIFQSDVCPIFYR